MTRNLKKDEELKILHRYLKASGTGEFQNIEPGEQPDFIISYENMKIGVEITEYHSDTERREVEELWSKLREWPLQLNGYPKGMRIILRFARMRLPNSREINDFVSNVVDLASKRQDVDHLTPDPEKYPTLAKYVTSIDLKNTDINWICWGWNYDVAWIGATDQELHKIVIGKAKSFLGTKEFDRKWLIVASGASLSRLTAVYDHQSLESYEELNNAIYSSGLSRFVLLQNPIIQWDIETGWATLPPSS